MRFWLLDAQEDDFEAVVITAFTVTDENGKVVCGAHSRRDAERKVERLLGLYPEHRFYIS